MILDGFTVILGRTDAFGTGNPPGLAAGGGVFIEGEPGYAASPTIRNCIFTNNEAGLGGAVFLAAEGTTAQIGHCQFINNIATTAGGAMYHNSVNGASANHTISHCQFAGNFATAFGGALYNSGELGPSTPTIANCTFTDNFAGNAGGGIFNNGKNSLT